MNIFTRIAGASSILFKGVVKTPFVATVAARYGGFMAGFQRLFGLDQYKNWVYGAVETRAIAVADIEIFLKNKKTGEKVDEHDVLKVIKGVNPHQTKRDLIIATQSYLDLNGNAYWFLARDRDGKGDVREIYVLRPDRIKIALGKGDDALSVAGYIYMQEGGKQIPLQPNEVLHFKNFNPLGNYPFPHTGIGVVEAASWAIQTDNETRTWNLNFFKNSARPDGILEVSGDSAMSAEEYQRLNAEWEEQHKGSENSHKTAVLSGGLTWKPVTPSQIDMQFVEQKKMNQEEILGLFKVPKILLGMTEGIQRSNADASIYMFNRYTVKPLMQRIIDTLNEFFVPEFGDDIELDFVSPVTEDRQLIINEYAVGIDKWLTRNEIRAREGLSPSEDGDKFFGTLAQVPIDEAKPEKKKLSGGKPVSKRASKTKRSIAEKVIEEYQEKKLGGKFSRKQVEGFKSVSPLVKKQYAEMWKAGLSHNKKQLVEKLETYFEKQEKEVLANVKHELKGVSKKDYSKKAVSDMLFDMDKAVTAGISLITPFIKEYLEKSGERSSVLTGADDFSMEDPKVQNFIKRRAEYFAKEINETTREKVLTTIQEGLDDQLSLDEISEKISHVYEIAKGSRTDMIARTEISAASNEGSKLAYGQAGITNWEWMVVDPEDEDCKENEGVIVKIGETFPDGSTQPPEPHPNCECTTLPVFEDIEE